MESRVPALSWVLAQQADAVRRRWPASQGLPAKQPARAPPPAPGIPPWLLRHKPRPALVAAPWRPNLPQGWRARSRPPSPRVTWQNCGAASTACRSALQRPTYVWPARVPRHPAASSPRKPQRARPSRRRWLASVLVERPAAAQTWLGHSCVGYRRGSPPGRGPWILPAVATGARRASSSKRRTRAGPRQDLGSPRPRRSGACEAAAAPPPLVEATAATPASARTHAGGQASTLKHWP
mmetsp:Transcript_144524/g.402692  ORF Transcript_144524/g.402692 Transcript_144524/m.402692 type:complete len:238 (-) Transcript_144524:97-810(-)